MQLFAATNNGILDIHKSQRAFAGREIRCLKSGSTGQVWAISDRAGIVKMEKSGDWVNVGVLEDRTAVSLLPIEEGILIGTTHPDLWIWKNGEFHLVSDFSYHEQFHQWYNPAGLTPHVRSMAQAETGDVYLNIHVGGILRTDAHFQSFIPTIDYQSDVHQVTYDDNFDRPVAACAKGLVVSHDQGKSWSYFAEGLHAPYCRAVAISGNYIFISANSGPHGRNGRLFKADRKNPRTLYQCTHGLPEKFAGNIDTFNLQATAGNVAFASPEGAIYFSENEGTSWEKVVDNIGGARSILMGH